MIPTDFPLRFLAGAGVRAHLQQHGFRLEDFPTLLGAAGGPKWLTLYGLDRELAPRLQRTGRAHDLLGASIGAWRFAGYTQADPVAAIDRLRASYTSEAMFSGARLDMTEVFTGYCQELLGQACGRDILSNDRLALHVMVTFYRQSRWPDLMRLGLTVASNLFGRSSLERFGGQRLMLSSRDTWPVANWNVQQQALTELNVIPALLASAAVPGFIRPVRNLGDDLPGSGIDGGLIDYHFDAAPARDRFVLYPHFYPHMVPGWFDKPFRRRWLDPRQVDNLLLVAPSEAFVASLPGGKLPDRNDPRRVGLAQCHQNWLAVSEASLQLGEAFREALERGWIPELVDAERR